MYRAIFERDTFVERRRRNLAPVGGRQERETKSIYSVGFLNDACLPCAFFMYARNDIVNEYNAVQKAKDTKVSAHISTRYILAQRNFHLATNISAHKALRYNFSPQGALETKNEFNHGFSF